MHHWLVRFKQGNVGHDPNEPSLFNVARCLWLTAFDGNEENYHRSRRQWLLQDEYSNEELENEFWLLLLFMFAWYRSTAVNPFTAPACKISGLKKKKTLPQTVKKIGSMTSLHSILCALMKILSPANGQEQYISSVLWQAYIQYCVLWWKSFHLLMVKNQKKVKDFKFRTFVGHFQATIALI